MTTTEDGMSEYSEELGAAYERIEYPREVYDRVCGRLSVKHPPLAKKQKVKDWLSDSQSSQAGLTGESEAPQRARKRKSKQSNDKVTEKSKKSAPSKKKTGKKITRKTLNLRGIKKKVKIEYGSDEESSDTTESEEDEDSSESDSSPENKKKRGSSASKSQREKKAKKEEKIRTNTEKSTGELKKSEHSENRGEKTRPRTEKPKEEMRRSSNIETKEEKISTGDVKKERKEVNVGRVEKKGREERGSDKDCSLGGKKPTVPSKEVSWKENGLEAASPSSPQPSSVPLPRKSILKNKSIPKTPNSPDDSVLPSCLQQLFNGGPSSRSLSTLSLYKVPRKKDIRDVLKTTEGPSVLMDKSEEGKGWNPRADAFVPPPRNFRKPLLPTPIGVERRKPFDSQRLPETKPTPLMLARPYDDLFVEDSESWKNTDLPMDPMTSLVPSVSSHSSDSFHSITHPLATAFTPKISHNPTTISGSPYSMGSIPSKSIVGTPSPHNQSREGMGSRKHIFPTPKSEGGTKSFHAGGGSKSWMPMESNESTRRRNSRWDRRSPPPGYNNNQDIDHSTMDVNTPMSPSQSASSPLHHRPSIDSSTPTTIPFESSTTVRFRLIPIDDECLPPWKRSDRYQPTPAIYAASLPVHKYEAMLVVGPIPDNVSDAKFDKIMKSKGTEVQWTEAAPTKDARVRRQRRIAVLLCFSEKTAKSLLAEGTLKFGKICLPVARPGEVLFSIEGFEENLNENELIEEVTDAIETDTGGLLVELLLFPMKNLVVKGKARFFQAIHGVRATHGAPISMGGGRSISFSLCPPDQSTVWMAQIHSPTPEDVRISSSLPSLPSPTVLPSPSNRFHPSHPQPVPSPSVVSLSASFGTIKKEISTTVSTSNDDKMGLSKKDDLPSVKKEGVSSPSPSLSLLPSPSPSSKFSCLPPPTAIPPPGLIDPSMLRLVKKDVDESRLYNQTLSIPPISVPGSLIPLPPTPIPPPIDMIPFLPYPDLPPINHVFFQPHLPDKRRSMDKRGLMKIDPASFVKPFKALLPKGKEGEKGVEDDREDDEILLFARPMGVDPQQTDWDAVREYFKDDDCSSRVYGGIVSLRLAGRKAREKAQVLLLEGPHTVNEQMFAVGLTYSVLLEATRAVGKTRLYDEVMEKFGSVIEVEKKGDTPSGNPVYKIYFDKLDKAQSAASEGITVGESILSNIGRIPQ